MELVSMAVSHSFEMGSDARAVFFWPSSRRLTYSGIRGSSPHQLVMAYWRAMVSVCYRLPLFAARWSMISRVGEFIIIGRSVFQTPYPRAIYGSKDEGTGTTFGGPEEASS